MFLYKVWSKVCRQRSWRKFVFFTDRIDDLVFPNFISVCKFLETNSICEKDISILPEVLFYIISSITLIFPSRFFTTLFLYIVKVAVKTMIYRQRCYLSPLKCRKKTFSSISLWAYFKNTVILEQYIDQGTFSLLKDKTIK